MVEVRRRPPAPPGEERTPVPGQTAYLSSWFLYKRARPLRSVIGKTSSKRVRRRREILGLFLPLKRAATAHPAVPLVSTEVPKRTSGFLEKFPGRQSAWTFSSRLARYALISACVNFFCGPRHRAETAVPGQSRFKLVRRPSPRVTAPPHGDFPQLVLLDVGPHG